MSFLDRYEFEQIIDEDLAVSRNQWQAEIVNTPQLQLSSAPKFKVPVWQKILIGLSAASLGFTLLHQPSFAHHPQSQSSHIVSISPTSH